MKIDRPLAFFDMEVYPNYFLIAFENEEGKRYAFELTEDGEIYLNDIVKIKKIISTHMLIGYNCLMYDCRLLSFFLYGHTSATTQSRLQRLYIISNDIINSEAYDIYRTLPIHPSINYIDLMPIGPNQARIGLKLYGARMHVENLVNLPYDPGVKLTKLTMKDVKNYCYIDIDVTKQLYEKIKERIDVRILLSKEYGIDLTNKSDAQIAEAVVRKKCQMWNAPPIPKLVRYIPPKYLKFTKPELQKILKDVTEYRYTCDENGKIIAPAAMRQTITIGEGKYKLGIGGLHSCEKSIAHISDKFSQLIDVDVESYYPNIILNDRLYPRALGSRFLAVYQSVTNKRLEAKRRKEKGLNEGLKIVINGSFGKFSSKYSVLFDPELLLRVTLTGQLALLMLIEKLEEYNHDVISANTDGLIVKVWKKNKSVYDKIISAWQKRTGFILESRNYKAVYSRDVSNYFAILESNEIKGRGTFNIDHPLQTNPHLQVCIEACINFLKNGTPIETSIKQEKDITKFFMVRQVTGGAKWKDIRLGKVVRWVWIKNSEPLKYIKNDNKVPMSDSSLPVMNLTQNANEVMRMIDRTRYITEAKKILTTIGGDHETST